ncbi:hypothetical protein EDD25_0417 [Cryobacterium psychrophilum]|nr:hypothetical protein EDD25_0417 [Cryobacterium psychrophilum]
MRVPNSDLPDVTIQPKRHADIAAVQRRSKVNGYSVPTY